MEIKDVSVLFNPEHRAPNEKSGDENALKYWDRYFVYTTGCMTR